MVPKICLIAALMIKYVAAITYIDDLVASDGDWWDDDFAYVANGASYDLNTNSWYQGVPDSMLNGTTDCPDCGGLIHGWYWQTQGS